MRRRSLLLPTRDLGLVGVDEQRLGVAGNAALVHEAAPCTLTSGQAEQFLRDILHLRTSAALEYCNSAMLGDVMIPIPQGRMVLDSVLETRQPLLPLQTALLHRNSTAMDWTSDD